MTAIDVVVFDFGGVLSRLGNPAIRAALESELGLQEGDLGALMYAHPHWDAVASGQITEREYWCSMASRLVRRSEDVRVLLRPLWGTQGAIEEVVDLVRALHGRVRLAVLSNWTESLHDDLASLGLDRYFDVVINSARVGVRKPHEAIFRHAIETLGVPPERILFIDDTPGNVEAASALGIQAVLFETPPALRTHLLSLGLLPTGVRA